MRPASTGQSTNFPPAEKYTVGSGRYHASGNSLRPARSKVPFTLKRRGDTSRL